MDGSGLTQNKQSERKSAEIQPKSTGSQAFSGFAGSPEQIMSGRLKVGGTALNEWEELAGRYKVSRVFVKNESENPCGTMKDRRNAELLEKYSGVEPIVFVQITSGNSGYSLGKLSKETGREIYVVNIVPSWLSPEIKNRLAECSIVVEWGLSGKMLEFPQMQKIALEALAKKGITQQIPLENVLKVESFGLKDGYRKIVWELKKQCDRERIIPTHIVCPVGEGELLSEIAAELNEAFGERAPRLIGATVTANIFAQPDVDRREPFIMISEEGHLVDKIINPYSKFLERIRNYVKSKKIKILAVEEAEVGETYLELKRLGIAAEPSAAVSFCAVSTYNFGETAVVVVINTGEGIYDKEKALAWGEYLGRLEYVDPRGRNVMMRAVEERNVKLLGILFRDVNEAAERLKNCPVRRELEEDWLAEVEAELDGAYDPSDALSEDLECAAKSLVAKINRQDNEGRNAFINAVRERKFELLGFFNMDNLKAYHLSEMMKVHDKWGKTAIDYALENKDFELAVDLLRYAAVTKTQFGNGETTLHYACRVPELREETVKFFLRHIKKNVITKNKDGLFPIEVALENGASIETLRLLIRASERRDRGETNRAVFFKLISKHWPTEDERIMKSNLRRELDIGRLIDAGMSPDWIIPSNGLSATRSAMERGDVRLVRLFKEKGAKDPPLEMEALLEETGRLGRSYDPIGEHEIDLLFEKDDDD